MFILKVEKVEDNFVLVVNNKQFKVSEGVYNYYKSKLDNINKLQDLLNNYNFKLEKSLDNVNQVDYLFTLIEKAQSKLNSLQNELELTLIDFENQQDNIIIDKSAEEDYSIKNEVQLAFSRAGVESPLQDDEEDYNNIIDSYEVHDNNLIEKTDTFFKQEEERLINYYKTMVSREPIVKQEGINKIFIDDNKQDQQHIDFYKEQLKKLKGTSKKVYYKLVDNQIKEIEIQEGDCNKRHQGDILIKKNGKVVGYFIYKYDNYTIDKMLGKPEQYCRRDNFTYNKKQNIIELNTLLTRTIKLKNGVEMNKTAFNNYVAYNIEKQEKEQMEREKQYEIDLAYETNDLKERAFNYTNNYFKKYKKEYHNLYNKKDVFNMIYHQMLNYLLDKYSLD